MRVSAPARVWVQLLIVLAVNGGCAGPAIGPKIQAVVPPADNVFAPEVPEEPAVESTSAPSVAADLGPAPPDLRSVDWSNLALPGDFCGVRGSVQYKSGEAVGVSANYGEVHLNQMSFSNAVSYGDIDGDGLDDAAVALGCDNGGGTASGQLAFGGVVVASRLGVLKAIGTVTARMVPTEGGHVTLIKSISLSRGKVVVDELWYRPTDSTCCPSGEASTTWMLSADNLAPSSPVVTR